MIESDGTMTYESNPVEDEKSNIDRKLKTSFCDWDSGLALILSLVAVFLVIWSMWSETKLLKSIKVFQSSKNPV